jgi:archaellum component FlaF (FlaF/FlaG flagellin family)
MTTSVSPPQRQRTIILVTACVAFALLSLSCGGGTPQSTPANVNSAAINLSPVSLTFASQTIGTTSSAQTVTLTNTGNATLTISSIVASGDFAQMNNCGTSVAPGANCTITVMFTPSASGPRMATLSIADNAPGSPQPVSLSGTGDHNMVLAWNASPTTGVTGYNVYRGTTAGGESSTPLNSTPVSGTTYKDESVTAGATYYYVVRAIAADGVTESADSNEASATVSSP